MSEILKDYCTTTEAADMLGIRVDSVIHLIANGKLKGQQVGRTWLVRKSDVEEYYRSKAPSGKPASRTPKLAAEAK